MAPVSGLSAERGVGVQVVALTIGAVPVGVGIARAPVERVELRVVGAGDPRRAAAVLGVLGAHAAFTPGIVTGLARRRYGVAAPHLVAGLAVPRRDVEARGIFRAGHAYHHFALHHQRRDRHGVGLGPIAEHHVPDHFPGSPVERNDMRIGRGVVHLVFVQRRATIAEVAAQELADAFGQRMRVVPDHLAGGGLHRVDVRVRGRDVHHPLVDQRCGVLSIENAEREAPDRHQALHVVGIDLGQRAVARAGVVAPRHQPIERLLVGIEQHFVGDGVHRPGRRGGDQHGGGDGKGQHDPGGATVDPAWHAHVSILQVGIWAACRSARHDGRGAQIDRARHRAPFGERRGTAAASYDNVCGASIFLDLKLNIRVEIDDI